MDSDGWFFKAETSKTQHGESFRKIMIENGLHLLDYPHVMYTDGCGSMVYVRDMAISMGINYIAMPPHSQSLNEAERIADRLWACARIQMISMPALNQHFAYGMDMACYVKLRMDIQLLTATGLLSMKFFGGSGPAPPTFNRSSLRLSFKCLSRDVPK